MSNESKILARNGRTYELVQAKPEDNNGAYGCGLCAFSGDECVEVLNTTNCLCVGPPAFLAWKHVADIKLPAKTESKPTNPKDLIGSTKLPTNLVPSTLGVYATMAFAEGASKYGAYNWREAGVRASIYKAAHDRHMEKWWNGEECDPVTKVPHLASAIACVAILADAKLCGKLTDDRPPAADMPGLIAQAEEVVKHLYALHADKNPRHWTIADNAVAAPT